MGGDKELFYSSLQLKTWYEISVGVVEDLVKEDVLEGKEEQSQRTNTLGEKAKALYYVRALEIDHSDSRNKTYTALVRSTCMIYFGTMVYQLVTCWVM